MSNFVPAVVPQSQPEATPFVNLFAKRVSARAISVQGVFSEAVDGLAFAGASPVPTDKLDTGTGPNHDDVGTTF